MGDISASKDSPICTLPIIDIRDEENAAKSINSACLSHGFFYLVGHEIEPDLDDAISLARTFFALPTDLKMNLRTNFCGRGYEPPTCYLGEEVDVIPENKKKRKESLMVGREVTSEEMEKWGSVKFSTIGPNQCPDESDCPGFRLKSDLYFQKCRSISERLLQLFAMSCGRESSFFQSSFASPTAMLRLLRYLPVRASPQDDIYNAFPHTDYGMFTLLYTDGNQGLQMKNGDTWVDILPIPGAFICNIGDALSIATGGVYKATEHRVVLDGTTERYSVAFFYEPSLDAPLRRFDVLVGGGSAASDAIEAQRHDEGSDSVAPLDYVFHLQKKCQETVV